MATQTQTHARNITINIVLSALAAAQKGFGGTLAIVPASNTMSGEPITTLNTVDDGQALVTAGEMTANTFLGVQAFYNQVPSGTELKIAPLLVGDSGNYATALARVRAVDDDFYGVAIEPRSSTEIMTVSAAVESMRKLFVFQSGDADWLTSGKPAAFADTANRERSIGIYHDTATQFADLAYLSNRLAADPNVNSAPWDAPLGGVASYASVLTSTQVGFLADNNINFGLPYAGEPFFVDPGHNTKGRAIHEILTGDWFEARLLEEVATTKVELSKIFEKWVLDEGGQNLLLNLAAGVAGQAEQAGHILPGSAEFDRPPISDADIAAETLTLTGSARYAGNARKFNITINLSR
jgi:hypothetical protein